MIRSLLPLLLVLGLIGCATAPVQAPTPSGAGTLARHADALAELDAWRMRARAAVNTDAQAGTLTMDWRQSGESYRLELRAPWGAGTVRVDGDPAGVVLRTSAGVQEFAAAPRDLLYRHTGLDLPIEALRYWLIGLPQPGAAADVDVDERGLVGELRQHGWRVRFLRYGEFGEFALPIRMQAAGEGVEVRIAVQDWTIEQ